MLVVSDHGAQRLDGGFCVNEWLVARGTARAEGAADHADAVLAKPIVDWSRTKVWSEGGYYARVFFNVQGREPEGVIRPGEYEDFLRGDAARASRRCPTTRGSRWARSSSSPRDVYRDVRNVAPDLIVHFGALYWRSIGGVGYDRSTCRRTTPAPTTATTRSSARSCWRRRACRRGARSRACDLLDIAPTLLELAGDETPATMQGRSLVQTVVRTQSGFEPVREGKVSTRVTATCAISVGTSFAAIKLRPGFSPPAPS